MIDRRIPGAKSAMGAAEQIISMMPPHRIYFEGFGGTGTVFLRKRPAELNLIVEMDGCAAAQLRTSVEAFKSTMLATLDARVIEGDAFDYAAGVIAIPEVLAYFDPPYVMSTRRNQRAIYRHEFDEDDHRRLAAIATGTSVRACIMISGYAGPLYEELFKGWRREEFTVMTRGGRARESVWCNFDSPTVLHDSRFVGKNFTDRQRIQRKAKRWADRVLSMPPGERGVILEAVQSVLTVGSHSHPHLSSRIVSSDEPDSGRDS